MREFGRVLLFGAAAFIWLLGCDESAPIAESSARGPLEVGFEASGAAECSTCRELELEDLIGIRRSYVLDLSNVLRLGRTDIASIDVMMHESSGSAKDAWSVVIRPADQGRTRLTDYCEGRSGRILIALNSEILVAALDREHVAERQAIVFFIPNAELLAKLEAHVGPLESRVVSDSRIDRRDACETVAQGNRDLLESCLKLVSRDPQQSRKEEVLLDWIVDEVTSGRMSEEEASRLLEGRAPSLNPEGN